MTKRYISVTEIDDSGSTCAVSQSLQPLPGGVTPNLLINGGFDIWQRGTSFTETGYTADRWRADEADGAFSVTREEFALGQTDVPGEPEFFVKIDTTTAGSSGNSTLEQRVESVRTLGGQSATLSFYAKVASGTLTVTPRFRQHFGTGGSPSADVDTDGSDITVTDVWQRFEVTVNVPSISGKTLGSDGNDYLSMMLVSPTSSTFELDISNAKFEVGDVATPFESRLLGEELALCQRYLCRYDGLSTHAVATGLCDKPAEMYPVFHYPVELRDVPTLSYSDAAGFFIRDAAVNRTVTSIIDGSALGTLSGSIQVNTTGLTAGRCANLLMEPDGWIEFDAEL